MNNEKDLPHGLKAMKSERRGEKRVAVSWVPLCHSCSHAFFFLALLAVAMRGTRTTTTPTPFMTGNERLICEACIAAGKPFRVYKNKNAVNNHKANKHGTQNFYCHVVTCGAQCGSSRDLRSQYVFSW